MRIFVSYTSDRSLISRMHKELKEQSQKILNYSFKTSYEVEQRCSKEEIKMAKRYFKKKCSSPLAVREIQFKAILRFHLTPGKKAEISKNAGKWWRKGTLIHCRWMYYLVQPLRKSVWRIPQKLKLNLPYEPYTTLRYMAQRP